MRCRQTESALEAPTRAGVSPMRAEFGVVCGVRAGAAQVVGDLDLKRPYGPWAAVAVEQEGALAGACCDLTGRSPARRSAATNRSPEGARS